MSITQKHQLGFPCMECKREDGSIHAKTNRVKKPKEKEMPGVKEIKDFRGNIISIPVNKRLHPYRYLDAFECLTTSSFPSHSDYKSYKPPVINPPKQNKANGDLGRRLEELEKCVCLFPETLPKVYRKYPWLAEKEVDMNMARGVEVFCKLLKSTTDDNWSRSLWEWAMICDTARKETADAASRKYYGMATDGKRRIRLSPGHIAEKCEEVEKFIAEFNEYFPYFVMSVNFIRMAIENDPELNAEYYRLSKSYDLGMLKQQRHQHQLQPEVETKDHHDGIDYYEYHRYVIRHRNTEYKKHKAEYQSGVRKSKPNKRIECGPFKISEFPPDIRQRLAEK